MTPGSSLQNIRVELNRRNKLLFPSGRLVTVYGGEEEPDGLRRYFLQMGFRGDYLVIGPAEGYLGDKKVEIEINPIRYKS